MLKKLSLSLAAAVAFGAQPATAADISTHVLDIAQGAGARSVPVTLLKQGPRGLWLPLGRTVTDQDGRIRSFADERRFGVGTYKLQFDMTRAQIVSGAPFFPEIDVVFRVTDARGRCHVLIVVSPYGYSTYRGN